MEELDESHGELKYRVLYFFPRGWLLVEMKEINI
jgi:hypothetical protein